MILVSEIYYACINFRNKHRAIVSGVIYIILIIFIAVIFNNYFYSPMRVTGVSMKPSLSDADIIIVDKISYKFTEPKRYEKVVFPYKYNNNTKYVKRVIGLPGETILIKEGIIYIDGKELTESYGIYENQKDEHKYANYGPVKLSKDEYFVMGDNRDNSDDSRSDDVGKVKRDTILGRAVLRIWPFNSIGSLKYQ